MLFFKYLFRCFRDLERDIKHLEGVISKDYGPEEEFASLSGQCFEYTDQEYTYKMCAFDYCSQRPNSQGKQVLSYKTTATGFKFSIVWNETLYHFD